MDLLTDLLRHAGVRRRLLDLGELTPGIDLPFPCDKSFGFHVALRGPLLLHSAGAAAPIQLSSGDIALTARGCHHRISLQAGAPPPDGPHLLSAAYQLWHAPVHPFFAGLPNWYVFRADGQPRLGPLPLLVELIGNEVATPDAGSDTIVHGLLDAAFSYLLRRLITERGNEVSGLGMGMRSPQIRQSLDLMHQDCAHDWNLEELAQRAALSRTAFAQKFRDALGDTPLSYLRTLRMQHAMRLLSESGHSLEAVAAAVGYQDAFGFSKVFKKLVGVSPREFRKQDAASADSKFRFRSHG